MIEHMTLTLQTPARQVFRTARADKILAEARNGFFCLLPRHADFVSVLVPGILTCWVDDKPSYWAVGRGVLVKTGEQVQVSTARAVAGDRLEELQSKVSEGLAVRVESEEQIRRAIDRLEAGFIRRFLDMEEGGLNRYGEP